MNGLIIIIQTAPTEASVSGAAVIAVIAGVAILLWIIIHLLINKTGLKVSLSSADITPNDNPSSEQSPSDIELIATKYPCLKLLPFASPGQSVKQEKYELTYYSPIMSKNVTIDIFPRDQRGKPYDHICGIVIDDKFVLMREVIIPEYTFPGDIYSIMKQLPPDYKLPSLQDMVTVRKLLPEINSILKKLGEDPLSTTARYLCAKKPEDKDYCCFDMETGKETYAESDDQALAIFITLLPSTNKH